MFKITQKNYWRCPNLIFQHFFEKVIFHVFHLFHNFSHNIKLWVSLTVRASMIVVIAGFPLPGPPRGDGRYYCYCCWTPRAPEHIQKSNIQHWDRNSKFHLFFHDGYVPSLDFKDILHGKNGISRRIFWCSGFAVAPMLKKMKFRFRYLKTRFFSTRILKWI